VEQLRAAVSENEAARAAIDTQEREAQTTLADLREAEATAGAEMERAAALVERYEAEVAALAEAMGLEAAFFAGTLERRNLAAPDLESATDDELRQRLARAQRDLRSVGAVDYGVMADYSVLKDRYESLSRQIEDLAQTEGSIRAGMADVRDQMRSQFTAAFEDVNRRFADLFRHLFRGGDAELLLAGDADSTQAGVDIVAQPPGKRLHRLATLSGGERALVGAALLLALIGANPSPFCMLDEVDAALDEANVQRFVETIRELARSTQFILVTHNRATMEAADALYGVTMSPGAVSQVVAIRLDDAVPAT
jgi:chromosome segregation protein